MAITDSLLKKCTLSKFRGDTTRCRWCNKKLTGRQQRWCSRYCGNTAAVNHWFSWARKSIATQGQKEGCVRCGSKISIEVNHKQPALGSHNKASCAHHISNLEPLCRRCHLLETAKQRQAGLLRRNKDA